MHDDPFARAVERVQAAEDAKEESRRKHRQAQITSGSRTAFRVHATVFVAVNLLLIAIWFTTWQLNDAPSYPWFLWPLLGWGIGLAAHYSAARNHLTDKNERPRPEAGAPGETVTPPAPPAPPAPSTTDELTRLTELHRSGALDDEEFRAAKAKLLQ